MRNEVQAKAFAAPIFDYCHHLATEFVLLYFVQMVILTLLFDRKFLWFMLEKKLEIQKLPPGHKIF
jgi:hypothetical protein